MDNGLIFGNCRRRFLGLIGGFWECEVVYQLNKSIFRPSGTKDLSRLSSSPLLVRIFPSKDKTAITKKIFFTLQRYIYRLNIKI